MKLVKVLVDGGDAASLGEARRKILQGCVWVDGIRATDISMDVPVGMHIIKVGKGLKQTVRVPKVDE